MDAALRDCKTAAGYFFWNLVNRVIVPVGLSKLEIDGAERLPAAGPFIVVANHSSRWDGPVVQYLLNRRANYMVSPNEMKGLQGAAVRSVGAFPANPRLDIIGHAIRQLEQDEPVVVFPEGNVFYDDEVHRFKQGAAKIALGAWERGLEVPVVPVAINYIRDGKIFSVRVAVGVPLENASRTLMVDEASTGSCERRALIASLTRLMQSSVVALRNSRMTLIERVSSGSALVA